MAAAYVALVRGAGVKLNIDDLVTLLTFADHGQDKDDPSGWGTERIREDWQGVENLACKLRFLR